MKWVLFFIVVAAGCATGTDNTDVQVTTATNLPAPACAQEPGQVGNATEPQIAPPPDDSSAKTCDAGADAGQ